MNPADLGDLLRRGEELYGLLLEKSVELSRSLDSLEVEEMAGFVSRREQILTDIQIFDTEFSRRVGESEERGAQGAMEQVRRFLAFREEVTRKILDSDALTVAFMKERMSEASNGLLSLARGRKALTGYENGNLVNHSVLEGAIY